jgi:hypothetical protein
MHMRFAFVYLWAVVPTIACSGQESGEAELGEQTLAQTLSPLVPVMNLDMERSVTWSDSAPRPERCDRVLHYDNDSKQLEVPLEGSVCDVGYEGDKPWWSSSYHEAIYGGAHSLQMTLPPRLGVGPNNEPCLVEGPNCAVQGSDRAELDVHSAGDEEKYGVGFNFNNPKYFGFAMYIAGSPDLLQNGLLRKFFFMQAWQYGCGRKDGAPGCGVPLTGGLQNGSVPGTLAYYFSAHDNGPNGGGHSVLPGNPIDITLNAWHTFLFFLHPNNNETQTSTGVITVWVDGALVADYHGDWGCNIGEADADNSVNWDLPAGSIFITDNWNLRVGMYRPGPGIINQRLDIFFDNVRLASSKKQADPHEIY